MIVAFDGNVFAGKTTLIDCLTEKIGCRRIAEHTFFVDQIRREKKYSPEFNEHLCYLQVDDLRQKAVGKGVVMLDRSFVSLSAHIYALYFFSGIDLREKHLQSLKSFLRQKKIIIPDFYVFVSCDRKIAQKRFSAGQSAILRGTQKMFIEKKYFSKVAKFNLLWQKAIANGCVVKSNNIGCHKLAQKMVRLKNEGGKKISSKSIINLTSKIFFNK